MTGSFRIGGGIRVMEECREEGEMFRSETFIRQKKDSEPYLRKSVKLVKQWRILVKKGKYSQLSKWDG